MIVPASLKRAAVVLGALALAACAGLRPTGTPASVAPETPLVGPRTGSVMVVGGGSMGPELWSRVIELAGRPAAPVPAAPPVGPRRGSVVVVGGGSMGPELWSRFIELAGGPDALIVDVPTAGGDSVYAPNWRGAGARPGGGGRG